MIFVTVGTNEASFDRLLRGVELIPADDILVQQGHSTYKPRNARCVDFLPFDTLVGHVRAADTVVTHAGVGSVMVALTNGKTPVVVPRLRRFGEAVDDHQLDFARRLERKGLVRVIEDPQTLATAPLVSGPPVADASESTLAGEIRGYLLELIGR